MEPVDPRMGDLLGGDSGGAESAGPEQLRSIVARAGRRRWRMTGAAAVVALLAGGGVGYAAAGSGGGSNPQRVATASGSTPQSARGATGAPNAAPPGSGSGGAGGSGASSIMEPARFTSIFTRQVGGVDIRAFLTGPGAVNPAGSAVGPGGVNPAGSAVCLGCGASLQAEVSTDKMVGIASGGLFYGCGTTTTPNVVTRVQGAIVGIPEGDPVSVVVVGTQPDAALVRMAFAGGGTDEMKPVDGWAVLAQPFKASTASSPITIGGLTVLDAAGHTIATSTVQWPTVEPLPAQRVPSGSQSTAGGTGASGTAGTSGSGSASSAIAYPCVSPPLVPTCEPPTTVKGGLYACPATVAPGGPATTPTNSGSGG